MKNLSPELLGFVLKLSYDLLPPDLARPPQMPISEDIASISTEWLCGLKELALGGQYIQTGDLLQLRWPHLALR